MTRAELNSYKYLKREITRERERLAALSAAATSTTAKISGLPHTGGMSDKTAIAGCIADCEAVIAKKLAVAMSEYQRINAYISSIDDSADRQVLTLRYIDGLSWQAVATEMKWRDRGTPRRRVNHILKE